MIRSFHTRAATLLLAAPLFVLACSDDSETEGSGGGAPTTTATTGGMTTSTTTSTKASSSSTGMGNTCETDVCATYGAAVPTVASEIVDAAATDPMFMADFAPLVAEGPAAVDAFKMSLANFISDAYGCTTGAYTGPGMVQAHTGLNITQAEYDAFIGLIAGVLADNGVPMSDINNCFAPPLVDPGFAGTIIGH